MEDRLVGRYKLLRRLAAGGMGEVYLAAQGGPAGFERVVALKRMLPTMAEERELVKLFVDEARLVARLSHRNICQIYELGEDGDGYFVAMEFVQGTSVRGLVERLARQNERIPPAMAVDIAAQVADALAYAYEAPGRDGAPLRIIHRDVTPQNVLLSVSGDVKLIDFGVAKSADQSHATESGTVKGKLAYMSPEQSRGKALDGRSDLFALGLLLYEMLAGKNPFARPNVIEVVMALQNEEAPPIASVDPSLAVIDPVLSALLAKSPDQRPKDANEAYELLSALKARLPRAPKRLGPFVSEHFSHEISAVIRSVSDSEVQRALKVSPPARETSDPVAEATEVGPDGLSNAPTALKKDGSGKSPVPTVPPDKSRRTAIVGTAIGFVLTLAAIGAFIVVRLNAPPPAVDEPIVQAPVPTPPPKPPPLPVAEPPKPPVVVEAARPKLPDPPPVVEKAKPDKKDKKSDKDKRNAKKDPKLAKVATSAPEPVKPEPVKPEPVKPEPVKPEPVKPEPVKPEAVKPEPVAPPAPAIVGAVSVSGSFGRNKAQLAGASGHVTLARAGELVIGLDWAASGGALSAKITSEPWAILSLDGVSKGKTPIALPPLGKKPLPLELRRLGGEPVQLVISAELVP